MLSAVSTHGIKRISAGEIQAALLTKNVEPTDQLIEAILTRTKPVDDAIQALVQAGDLIADDAMARNGVQSDDDAQALTQVIARVVDTTDALLLVRGSMITDSMPADDEHLPALLSIAHETSDAIRKAAAH